MIGQSIAHYRITAKLGEGGMGEVYRATDIKLSREVAIKILPSDVAQDPDRLARFEREAKVLASLNHPNIAAIYGLEDRALIMELVEGETLTCPVPLDTALTYARQLTDALDYAHEKGIIHRDLKPANIKITPEGQLKILDFGLAKIAAPEQPISANPASSPTLTMRATQAGLIMGTAAYMSPEQARGHHVDKRADIWSFGVVLYEMLTGRKLFEGETIGDTLAEVLKKEIDWNLLPANTPPQIKHLLTRCLERDRKKRLRDLGEAWTVLVIEQPVQSAKLKRPLGWIAATFTAVLMASIALLTLWRKPIDRQPIFADIELGPGPVSQPALSPDGTRLAYITESKDGPRLAFRRLDNPTASILPGVVNPMQPFFSPDGKWIAFFAQGKLRKVPVEGGSPVDICDAPNPRGGSWGDDGYIVAALNSAVRGGLSRVNAAGGRPQPLTSPELGSNTPLNSHRWPHVLPGSKAVVYVITTTGGGAGSAYLVDVASGKSRQLMPRAIFAQITSGSQLFFQRDNTLLVAQLDRNFTAVGEPFVVADKVALPMVRFAQLDISSSGAIVYAQGGAESVSVAWLNRDGTVEPLVTQLGSWNGPRISPDGRWLAVYSSSPQNIWVRDISRELFRRITFGDETESRPVWSADGQFLFFYRENRIGWRRLDGIGSTVWSAKEYGVVRPHSVSPDGKLLAMTFANGESHIDLAFAPIIRKGESLDLGPAKVVMNSSANQIAPVFSPDSRWLAFTGDDSGRYEVYVTAVDPNAATLRGLWQVSTSGGFEPRWSPNSPELVYEQDARLHSVRYRVENGGFVSETPRLWTDRKVVPRGMGAFDFAPDGKRVAALIREGDQEESKQFRLILNADILLRRTAERASQP